MTQQQLEIAIQSALAALERPTYGDREEFLDNVAAAHEILETIRVQQQLEAPVRSEDFEAIAAIIKIAHKGNPKQPAAWTAYNIAEGLTEHMSETNPRFNRNRFMLACGFATGIMRTNL